MVKKMKNYLWFYHFSCWEIGFRVSTGAGAFPFSMPCRDACKLWLACTVYHLLVKKVAGLRWRSAGIIHGRLLFPSTRQPCRVASLQPWWLHRFCTRCAFCWPSYRRAMLALLEPAASARHAVVVQQPSVFIIAGWFSYWWSCASAVRSPRLCRCGWSK